MDFERVIRLKTGDVTDTTTNSASVTGFIQDVGEFGIIQCGHCWSIYENPTIINSHTTNSSGIGSFTSNITGLSPNTIYYIRAYATSRVDTAYGNQNIFTTLYSVSPPTVVTSSISNITTNSASGGGNVISDGGATVTARGVCWSTDESPAISDSLTIDGSGTGSFTSNITGLSINTKYYVRAYVTNSEGTSYGIQRDFTTKDITIGWQKLLGGSSWDVANSIQQTTDGGYIIAGQSSSNNGDVSGNHGNIDYWIVKLNSTGELAWQKSLGGSNDDWAYSVQQTTDGGYIIAGSSYSIDYDVFGNHGGYDYWIVKLNSTGEIDWQKSLGGSNDDWAYSVQQTTDGGYIIAGSSCSIDYDVFGNHGGYDYWIVKLNSTGELDWQKSLGGSGWDIAYSIQQTIDGGYIIAGKSDSDDDDISGSYEDSDDYWIVKLNSTGELDWQKALGGSSLDVANSIQQTTDGGYIIAGQSNSNSGDVDGNHGNVDCWIVKLNSTGELDWQKSLGGSSWDVANSIQQTTDGGYIIAGQSSSNNGDVSGNQGGYDYWIVKLNSTGELYWQQSYGGSKDDSAFSVQQTTDGGYIICGESRSIDGDVPGNHGENDIWIIRIVEN